MIVVNLDVMMARRKMALSQLSDGIQNVSVGILRGIQDVKIIMPIALISYWLLNLPVGYLLGFGLKMGPAGLFLGFTFGLSSAGVLMIRRIRRSVRRLRSELPPAGIMNS